MDSAAPVLNQCEKLNLLSIVYDAELSVSSIRLLSRFIDRPASLLWSSERLAKSIQRSVRTVERSIAELRALGILETVRRGIFTLLKVLRPERIVALGKAGAAAAKEACATAKSLIVRVNPFTRQSRRPISSLDIKKGDENAPWKVQGPAPDYLLRYMGLPTGEKRRKPKV
jgi:hypothetical protein